MKAVTNYSRYDKGYRQIHFNLKQTKDSSKLTQIIISLTVRGERLRVYSKLRVEPEYWNKNENRCNSNLLVSKRVHNRILDINSRLDYIEHEIEYTDHVCAEKGLFLTRESIIKVVTSTDGRNGSPKKVDTLKIMKQIAGNYQNSLNRRGQIGQANTGRTYLMAISRLENYLNSIHRKELKFDDFNKKFIADFSDYLTRYSFIQKKVTKHYTATTIINTLGAIRNILRRAYEMELSDNSCQNLFDTFTANEVSDKIYLSEGELGRLAKVNVKNQTEMNVRNLFIIAGYTGLRISDINRLNEAAFSQDQITLVQTKTKNLVHVPILKEVVELIEKYKNCGFPHLNVGNANSCIKDLAKRAGIDDTIIVQETRGGVKQFKSVPKYSQVSFHTARRSCITNLFKRGYSTNFIMSLSGHKSIASFQRYIKSSEEEMSQAFINELRKRKDIRPIKPI